MSLVDRALAETEGEHQAMRTIEIPQRVRDLGGPEKYAAQMAETLNSAIDHKDWDIVRQIATDPHVDDATRAAAAGALDDAGVTHTQNRHGVPESAVQGEPEGRIIGRSAEAAPAEPEPIVGTDGYVHPVGGGRLKLTMAQYNALLRALDGNRVGKKQGQSHLEAWDVRRHLIRVFGFGGFQIENTLTMIHERIAQPGEITYGNGGTNNRPAYTVVYQCETKLTIFNADGTVGAYFEDAATGDGINQQTYQAAADFGIKTAVSQALKRCAVNLGDMFGLSLYNHGSTQAQVQVTLVPPPALVTGQPPQATTQVDTVTHSERVRGEEQPEQVADLSTEAAPDAPGDAPEPDGLPSAETLKLESLQPETPLRRLRAIQSMIHPQGDHPAHGATKVFNENGDEESLAHLVWRHIKIREKAGEKE